MNGNAINDVQNKLSLFEKLNYKNVKLNHYLHNLQAYRNYDVMPKGCMIKIKPIIFSNTMNTLYEGQSKNNEPKSLLAIFVAIKSKVIHQKKAQG